MGSRCCADLLAIHTAVDSAELDARSSSPRPFVGLDRALRHGDRFGLARRARRLHKSRDTIEYFGSSIANGSMAEDGTKIPRSRSPEAGCWSTNLNLHGEIWSIFRPPNIEKS